MAANDRFRVRVEEFMAKTGISLGLLTKRIAFGIHRKIVLGTPVDTGRARASWNIVAGESPDMSTADQFNVEAGQNDKRRDANAAAASGFAVAKQGKVPEADYFIISNNLPYIERLENGYSKQAPQGMVRIAVASERAELEAAITRVVGEADIQDG